MTSTDGLQRRTVLAAALIGTAALAAPVLRPAQAAAASGLVTLQGQQAFQPIYGPDGSCLQVPAQLGALLTAGAAGVPAGTAVTFTYDERLYSAASRAFLTGGGHLIPVESRSHGGQLELLLPKLDPGSYVVHAGGLTAARFPADLVADPLPTTVRVSEQTQTLSKPAAKAGLPWGAQLGVGWQQTRWSEYYAWYPGTITVHSVGPGEIPAGSKIRLTLDRRVFESVTITAAADSLGQKLSGTGRRTTTARRAVATWTTHVAVAPDSRITLTCGAAARSLTGPLDDVEAPLIEFLPGKSLGPQRSTGQESITRMDNVYSAATRAQYAPN